VIVPASLSSCTLKRFLLQRRDASGAEVIEYALLTAIIALSIIVAVSRLGCQIDCVYQEVALFLEKGRENIPPGQMRQCMDGCRQN
jgi:Flp pilus assembly pilin Flp